LFRTKNFLDYSNYTLKVQKTLYEREAPKAKQIAKPFAGVRRKKNPLAESDFWQNQKC